MSKRFEIEETREPSNRVTVTIPRSLSRRVSAEARASGRSVSSIVREALAAHLDRQGRPPQPSFVGIGDSGRTDVSERAEELVEALIRRKHKK